ncbi:hypothetical protein [Stenotrophomonas sp. JAI102]|uniref:hypothetical protein n=1 Tax=Stenotrophomonas sp. JAI102 TaxID=2723077 RepID=UPI0015C92CDA
MSLTTRLLRWTATPMGRRALFVLTAAIVTLMACNPLLVPLLPVVDALGLDVLLLLIGAQAMALLPWVRLHASRIARVAARLLLGALAGFIGGYLRQLVFGNGARWTRTRA